MIVLDDVVSTPEPVVSPVEVFNDITVIVPTPEPTAVPTPSPVPEVTPAPTPAPVSVFSVDAGSSDRGGVVGALVDVLGEYEPCTVTTTTTAADGSVTESVTYAAGLASIDWPWLGGLLCFAILIYGFVRIIGGLCR